MDICYDSWPVRARWLPPPLPRFRTPTFAKAYDVARTPPRGPEDEFLRALAADPDGVWPEFLIEYTSLIRTVIARLLRDTDHRSDAYVTVCEKLKARRCYHIARYVSLPPEDPPRCFKAWLRRVTRNTTFDWYRGKTGRDLPPVSVQECEPIVREIYHLVFQKCESYAATVELLVGKGYPRLTVGEVGKMVDAIHSRLPRTKRWTIFLNLLKREEPLPIDGNLEEGGSTPPVAGPSELEPDQVLAGRDWRAQVLRALEGFDPVDRLILHYRYEQDLGFAAIARLVGLDNARIATQRCRVLVHRLRRELGVPDPTPAAPAGGGGGANR